MDILFFMLDYRDTLLTTLYLLVFQKSSDENDISSMYWFLKAKIHHMDIITKLKSLDQVHFLVKCYLYGLGKGLR